MTDYSKQYPGVEPDCLQLAELFLDDREHTEADVWDLAACIQNAIEDWFAAWEREKDEQEDDDDVEAPPEPDDD